MSDTDKPKKLTREERLAEQLRANLRRRKTAAKRQKANAAAGEDSGETSN